MIADQVDYWERRRPPAAEREALTKLKPARQQALLQPSLTVGLLLACGTLRVERARSWLLF